MKTFASTLVLGVALLGAACQPPGPKALLDGERLIRDGQYERALKRLNKAAELLPANAQVWNHIGLAQHGLRRPAEAVQAYQQALKLDRNLAAAHFNLGALYLELNRLPEAVTSLTIFTTVQPDNPDGWLKLGTALLRGGRPDEAERALQNALRRAPRDPEIHNNLGLVHVQRKRPQEAMQCFNNALRHAPGYAPAILNQAVVAQYHFRNPRSALEYYQAYLETKPAPANTPEVQVIMAELRAALEPPPVVAAAPVEAPPADALQERRPPPSPATNVAAAQPRESETKVAINRASPPAERPARTEQSSAPTRTPPAAETPPREQTTKVASAEPAPPEPAPAAEQTVATAARTPAEREPEPQPEPEPEPEPEETPVQVVQVQQDPVFRPVVASDFAPRASITQPAPAAPPAETERAPAAASEPTPPLLISRRDHEDDPGLMDRLNPARLFRRDREREIEGASPAPPQPRPGPRVVREQPRQIPPQDRPIPINIPRYAYQQGFVPPRAGNRAEAERAFAQGVEAQREKRFGEAIQMYNRALAADPTYFEAAYNLGLAAYQGRNLPQALAAGEQAVRLKPESLNARYNFALALRDANYPVDAMNELRELLVESPDELRAHLALANIYAQALDQPLMAERHYRRVLELQPDHPDAGRIRLWLAHPQ